MKKDKVSVKVLPDSRRTKGEGRFPLKLRITHKGERKYYGTGFDASSEEWVTINSAGAKGDLRRVKNDIAEVEKKAQECAGRMALFSFKQFERDFFGKSIRFESLRSAFDAVVARLESEDRWGTASSYRTACNALYRYKIKISVEDVDQEFLQKFEKWAIADGKSITTVGIYLRALRTVINVAIDNGSFKKEAYPFGKRKYVIPAGKNIKKALSIDQIKQVFEFPTETDTSMAMAKDFWIFTYLCNGINMMDIARLKGKDVESNSILFIREKTKRTTKGDPLIITAPRNAQINQILARWGNIDLSPGDYVFSIIGLGDSAKVARAKIQQFTKLVNKWMKRIGEELGFNLTLTTYVARHSFATILLRNGAPIIFTSKSLGHASVSTTERYFAGFDLAQHEKYSKILTNFD